MVGYEVKLNPPADEVDRVMQTIVASYSADHAPIEWGIFLTDPDTGKQNGGGATGYAVYDWAYIQFFAIPPELRGRGAGRELMERIEAFARERGLTGIFLDTFEFQARGFYEKLGFTVFGTIADHPKDQSRFFLEKRLEQQST
jgi:ribosomal protein S18 acetylase RimI-like enzyme